MDRYLILERFMFEQENLEEQLIPTKDWVDQGTKFDADAILKKRKEGKAREATFTKIKAPKIDPSKGSSPNLPAVVQRQFVGGAKKPLSKTVKYIGAAVLSAAIIALAYQAYKRYKQAKCIHMTPEQKSKCIKDNKIKAFRKEIDTLNNLKSKCQKSSDAQRCMKDIGSRIDSIEKQIKKAA